MNRTLTVSILGATLVALTGCQSNPIKFGGQSNVAVVDSSSRTHLQANLTMTDYTALAEQVTNKMLSSKFVQRWGSKKPKLILAKLRNNTSDESIMMRDIYDRITETLLNSGAVRLVDKSATSFDYVVRSELSSKRQYNRGGEELAEYKLELKMFKLDGEMKGQWSGTLTLAKGKKSYF
ncbi:MAG: hypothetical protein JKX87_01885 [Cycloclasticus sp.]|nr:hypothetical protein [Cycloclasticus sp.]